MATVALNHNYGTPGALRYQTLSGMPVEGAIVRVYRKTDFDQGSYDSAVGVTLTNARGEWANPINVDAGLTYTVQFHKEGLYGPDKVEVVI
jgi:hypothetical protein